MDEERASVLARSSSMMTVFYATVVVDGPAGEHLVDARPSDVLNLALVTGAPT